MKEDAGLGSVQGAKTLVFAQKTVVKEACGEANRSIVGAAHSTHQLDIPLPHFPISGSLTVFSAGRRSALGLDCLCFLVLLNLL
jgi:hypothetical protein